MNKIKHKVNSSNIVNQYARNSAFIINTIFFLYFLPVTGWKTEEQGRNPRKTKCTIWCLSNIYWESKISDS